MKINFGLLIFFLYKHICSPKPKTFSKLAGRCPKPQMKFESFQESDLAVRSSDILSYPCNIRKKEITTPTPSPPCVSALYSRPTSSASTSPTIPDRSHSQIDVGYEWVKFGAASCCKMNLIRAASEFHWFDISPLGTHRIGTPQS